MTRVELIELVKFTAIEVYDKITDVDAESILEDFERQCNIDSVVGQSEQLFCTCKKPAEWETQEGWLGCVKCNKRIKAK